MTLNMNCRLSQDIKAGVGKEGTTLEGDKSSWRRSAHRDELNTKEDTLCQTSFSTLQTFT